jgi:UDP-3-O-[3-hydroxymyristoyl] glucosamine N-acyltransferase
VIEDGVKLDNLIQVAHNVRIGAYTAIAACTAIAGSVTIGKHCTIAGAAMFVGHITLVDHVHVTGGTAITRSITKPGVFSGLYPSQEHGEWEKNAATLRNLHALRDRVRALEKKN